MLNQYFEHIYCLNLDRRTDRWNRCQEIFLKKGWKVERVSACDLTGKMEMGLWGKWPIEVRRIAIALSVAGILMDVKRRGLSNALIFEDDVEVEDDFDIRFPEGMKVLPRDWEFLYLGCNPQEVTKFGKGILRVQRAYATHALAVQGRGIQAYLETVITLADAMDLALDSVLRHYNAFTFTPNLAYQRNGFSDIEAKEVNYDFLRR